MPLTYEESSTLMNDMTFRGRVKVSCLQYAKYISDEDPKIPAHNTRLKWANQCIQMPDTVAQQVTPPVVMDPVVRADGAKVTDAQLQSAVEGVVNSLI